MKKNRFHPLKKDSGGEKAGWVETSDDTRIYVETAGRGTPILLVHGWTMSGRFWLHQMAGLSGRFQVVTMDLRGHGNSPKTLEGHTMPSYAEDIHGVISALNLKDVVLAGWSLAGPVVLEYWRRFGGEKLSALALVEMTPFPFSPEKWNTHALKGYNFNGMHASFRAMGEDRKGFGERFVHNMFKKGEAPGDVLDWMVDEYLKTPAHVAVAVYSDYVMRDCTDVLKDISVPGLAVFGDSHHLCFGSETGSFVADQMPRCRLEVLDDSGHMPFYEQPEEFNEILSDLALMSEP